MNIFSNIPSNEKYVIFLQPNYFKKTFLKSTYRKFIKNLELKGINVFNIDKTVSELKSMYKYKKANSNKLKFDDSLYPNINTLYIHLFNGQYYNDTIYNKKKLEIEREMLFLLAGKLGVQYISYTTDIIETTITKANAGISLKKLNLSMDFNKSVQTVRGIMGREEYLNRGAPVYLKSNNLKEVEENIKDKMGTMNSNVFNYDFYKNSIKLESFVYKRFEFKMLNLEYTIETDDISELSFSTKAAFMDVGLKLLFDKNIIYNEKITYTLEFFTDIELKKEFGKIKRDHLDPFYSIRELYDLMEDKDKAVHLICEYTMELANKYKYNLSDFIIKSEAGFFESICHHFQSTSQIKNWLLCTIENNETLNESVNTNTHIRKPSVQIYSIPIKPTRNSESAFIERPLNIVEQDFNNRLYSKVNDNEPLTEIEPLEINQNGSIDIDNILVDPRPIISPTPSITSCIIRPINENESDS